MEKIIIIFTLLLSLFLIGCNPNKNVDEVINLIEELSIHDEITYEHGDEILLIKDKYNDLNAEEKKKCIIIINS